MFFAKRQFQTTKCKITKINCKSTGEGPSQIWPFPRVKTMLCIPCKQGRRNSGRAGGQEKSGGQWKLVKNKNRYQLCLFWAAKFFASKMIAKIVENHSEFCGCANSCNKFVSSWSWKTMQFSVILLWNGTSAPVAPFSKRHGNTPVISPLSSVPEITYDAVM